jgi:hypothetical protein
MSIFPKPKIKNKKKLDPTYNNNVVTFSSAMLKRISETTYEEAKERYEKIIYEKKKNS